eukprot:INCI15066.3.p1 GENE.INCI15066.3~~INCI15066.3.p1  ORF type:complete len:453 (-),score=89.70 INCI15066.3:34-1392(-)
MVDSFRLIGVFLETLWLCVCVCISACLRSWVGLTALYAAVGGSHLDVVRQLIAAKARTHVVDAEGLTPLHEAANNGDPDLVRLLLAHGARVSHVAHSSGATALHMAAVGGSSSATRVDWYQVLGIGRSATAREISLAYRALALKFHPDKQGSAPHAHTHDDKNTQSPEEMFKRISEANEVLSDPTRRAEFDNAYPQVIAALLRAGADKRAKTNGENPETPAMLAIRCRQFDLAVLLSDDIDARYGDGRTALHHALTFQDKHAVETILRSRADVSVADDDGYTALHVACGNADAGVIRLILNACKTRADFGAVDSLSSIGETRPTEVQHEIPDSNSESSSGRKFPEVASLREGSNGGAAKTPSADTKGLTLAAATSEGDVGTHAVNRLLSAKDKRGQTALLLATLGGDAAVVELLLDAKADPLATDGTEMTVLDYARDMGFDDVADILAAAAQ